MRRDFRARYSEVMHASGKIESCIVRTYRRCYMLKSHEGQEKVAAHCAYIIRHLHTALHIARAIRQKKKKKEVKRRLERMVRCCNKWSAEYFPVRDERPACANKSANASNMETSGPYRRSWTAHLSLKKNVCLTDEYIAHSNYEYYLTMHGDRSPVRVLPDAIHTWPQYASFPYPFSFFFFSIIIDNEGQLAVTPAEKRRR